MARRFVADYVMNPLQFYKTACSKHLSFPNPEDTIMSQFLQAIPTLSVDGRIMNDYRMEWTSSRFPMFLQRDKQQCHKSLYQLKKAKRNVFPNIPDNLRPEIGDIFCYKKG